MDESVREEVKKNYDPKYFEPKWQKYWEESKIYKSEIDHSKPKYYILDMLPYPSGAGLHVGHPVGYTATDIISRHKRQLGYNVMHPMGWDSFGLPAEQYAIRTGVHPKITTQKNINNIRKQLKALGFDYDWDREVATSDPSFYKWTQWIFSKLYEKGLAYQADMNVNFCPALGTVLANEEVENGKSKLGGHPVEKRPFRQWILKITEYADRLLEDLEDLDWPEGTKKLQRNWIGKSEGVRVYFVEEKTQETISTFTTRHDTLFGITFIVLAPEHPLINKIVSTEQKASVEKYVKDALAKCEIKRSEEGKEKTGVWTGAFCTNPVTGKKIPIWIADYVLINYGTGAVLAVPGDDQRDFDFAKKYNLPIFPIIDPESAPEDISLEDYKSQINNLEIPTGGRIGLIMNSHSEKLDLNGLTIPQAKEKAALFIEENNIGERTVVYKLRDWLFSRQRYWGEPMPILHLEDGSIRCLDLDELPLLPPEIASYQPSKVGKSPLEQDRDWVEIIDSKTGKKALRETNTMPNWAGSCWYYLRYLDPKNNKEAFSEEAEKYWMPVDLYVGGVEHAVLHLLYARFWHKVLFDIGLVHTKEPFQALCNQGLVNSRSFKTSRNLYVPPEEVVKEGNLFLHKDTGESLNSQIEKMSKSKLNGLSPDEVIEEYSTDALRLYEMFMAPIEKEKVWNTESISGCYRFLNRFYELCISDKLSDVVSDEALKIGHTLYKGVKEDIEALQFNTAIAKMMIFINDFSKLSHYPKQIVLGAIQCIYPFAPHTAYELWELLGGHGELAFIAYPEWNPEYLEEKVVTYVVQINGKLRGRFELPKDQDKDTIIGKAKEHPNISKHLNAEIVKTIFVPNKLLNFVIKS